MGTRDGSPCRLLKGSLSLQAALVTLQVSLQWCNKHLLLPGQQVLQERHKVTQAVEAMMSSSGVSDRQPAAACRTPAGKQVLQMWCISAEQLLSGWKSCFS